jgi:DNA-binding MarR family transcriptional regulator
MRTKKPDVVDTLIADWSRERPDLDPSGMNVAARVVVLANAIQGRVDELLASFGLAQWSFDVLATLRRQPAPHRLSPTSLSNSTMLSTAAMVNRLDRLEARNLVRRLPNLADRRGVIVELTPEGRGLVDQVMPVRFDEANAVSNLLSARDQQTLTRLLKRLADAVHEMLPVRSVDIPQRGVEGK